MSSDNPDLKKQTPDVIDRLLGVLFNILEYPD